MSALYPQGASHLLGKTTQVNLLTDTLKVLFYVDAYSSAHEYVSDLTGASIVARSGALTGPTLTAGVFDCNDITLTAVSGAAFTHVLLYKDSGADASSVLIAEFTVVTYTPDGGDVHVVFSPTGLFSIA